MNALLATLSCVYSEIMFTIISFFQKLIKGGGWNKSGGLENISKINKRGGDDYSVLESTALFIACCSTLFSTDSPIRVLQFL